MNNRTLSVILGTAAACGATQGAKPSPPPVVDEAAPAVAPAFPAGCDKLVFDLESATLNGLPPTATMADVKAQFPCSTGESSERSAFNYGGGVFFLKHGMFFYTGRDFIEVRRPFAGEVVPAVLGEDVATLDAWASAPAQDPGQAPVTRGGLLRKFYDRSPGCLRADLNDENVVIGVAVYTTTDCATALTWL